MEETEEEQRAGSVAWTAAVRLLSRPMQPCERQPTCVCHDAPSSPSLPFLAPFIVFSLPSLTPSQLSPTTFSPTRRFLLSFAWFFFHASTCQLRPNVTDPYRGNTT